MGTLSATMKLRLADLTGSFGYYFTRRWPAGPVP